MNHQRNPAMIEIKTATTKEEIKEITRLRYDVYVQELGVYTDKANHELKVLTDERDHTDRLIYIRKDDEIIGAGSITVGSECSLSEELNVAYDLARFQPYVSSNGIANVTRLVVKPEHRGTSVPFKLMMHIVEEIDKIGCDLIFCTCKPHLMNLYSRLGLRSYDVDMHNDAEFGFMIPMVLVMGDSDHLNAVRSPLRSVIDANTHDTQMVAKIVQAMGEPTVRRAEECTQEIEGNLALETNELAQVMKGAHVISCKAGSQIIKGGQESASIFIPIKGFFKVKTHLGEESNVAETKENVDVYSGEGGIRMLALSKIHVQKILEQPSKMAQVLMHNAVTPQAIASQQAA